MNSPVITGFPVLFPSLIKGIKSIADVIPLFFLILVVFLINIDIFRRHKHYDIQKRELESYKQYLPLLEDMIDKICIRQHDFNNHLQTLHMLPLTYTDYDSLKKALFSYEAKINAKEEQIPLLKLNKKLVAGFLICKMATCEKQKKTLQVEILNYCLQCDIPESTLIELLGILIDNAIEASPEGETIYLQINSKENQVRFIVKNIGTELTPQLRTLFFQKGYTTKESSDSRRGLGLYKLKQIADTNHGIIILDNELLDDKQMISFELRI